jgi:GntR family transcriptional regulator
MLLQIDSSSGTPIYLQIMQQLKHAVAMGVFQPGDPIPTIREMALQTRVNPNTVARAVRELEREGVLVTQVGKGSFVSAQAPGQALQARDAQAEHLAKDYGKDMRWLGYSRDTSASKVIETWEETQDHE